MSDQPKWMPDAERLCMAFDLSDQAWEEISDGERGPDGSWLDPLRAVVLEAVEKALAEQEARHKREVLEAKISALMDFRVEIGNETGLDDALAMYLTYLRAELAALEVKP